MILETEFSRKKGAIWQRYGSSIARDLPATRLMVAAFRFWVLARNRVFKKKLGFNAKGGSMAALWELYRTGFAVHSCDGCSVSLLGTGQKPSFQEKTRFQCKRELYGSSIALIIHSFDHSLFIRTVSTRVIELFLPSRI